MNMEKYDSINSTFIPYGSSETPSPISPAFGLKTRTPFTIVYTIIYSGIFAYVYFQLLLILYHGHKRLSYQTVFLYICLIWAALRTTLFSFFYNDTVTANQLSIFFHWLLFCAPSILQYSIMNLLFVFFAQLIIPNRINPDLLLRRKKRIFIVSATGFLLFVVTNISCAILTKIIYTTDTCKYIKAIDIVIARVIINDGLFMLSAISLAICIVQLRKRPSAKAMFESKGMGFKGAIIMAVFIIIIFVSRVIYNFMAVFNICPSFGYGWINVSDQAELKNLTDDMAYLSFGLVLLFWECLPTLIIVMFFRVKTRSYSSVDTQEFHERTIGSLPGLAGPSYFFDNRNRYNSTDDITHASIPQSPRSSAVDIYTIGQLNSGHSYSTYTGSKSIPKSPVGLATHRR